MILKELKIKTNLDEATNCYIVHDEESKETMVIDPAGEAEKIIEDNDFPKELVINYDENKILEFLNIK